MNVKLSKREVADLFIAFDTALKVFDLNRAVAKTKEDKHAAEATAERVVALYNKVQRASAAQNPAG